MSEEISVLLEQLDQWFLASDRTLGFAESCTGGLISSLLTERPGVSKYFLGSVVCYDNSVKTNLLGVKNSLIQALGPVSVPVAKAMALGLRETLDCDWAVSVTGIAGPSGGSKDVPVGTVCVGVVGPGIEEVIRCRFEGQRKEVQESAARLALEFLWKNIKS